MTQILSHSCKTEFNLEQIALHILSNAKASLATEEIAIHYHYAIKTPRLFHDDAEKIQQIIDALLQQAIQHTDAGNITLSIYHDRYDPQSIIVSVADTRKNKTGNNLTSDYQDALASLKGKAGSMSDLDGTCHWVRVNLTLSSKSNNFTINSLGGHSIAFLHNNEDTLKYINQYLEDWGAKSYCSKTNSYNHIPLNTFDLIIITPHDFQQLKNKINKLPVVLLDDQYTNTKQIKQCDVEQSAVTLAWPNTTDQLLNAIMICLGIQIDPAVNNKKSIYKDYKDRV